MKRLKPLVAQLEFPRTSQLLELTDSYAREPVGVSGDIDQSYESLTGGGFHADSLLDLCRQLQQQNRPGEAALLASDGFSQGIFTPQQAEQLSSFLLSGMPGAAAQLLSYDPMALPPFFDDLQACGRSAEPQPLLDPGPIRRARLARDAKRADPDYVDPEAPGIAGILGERGHRLEICGLLKSAACYFAAARFLDPTSVPLRVRLIDLALDNGWHGPALKLLVQMVKKTDDPEDPNLLWVATLAVKLALLRKQLPKQGDPLFPGLPQDLWWQSKFPYLLFARAAIRVARGLLVSALEEMEQQRSVCQHWPWAARMRAATYIRIFGHYDPTSAFRGFDEATQWYPGDTRLWNGTLGLVRKHRTLVGPFRERVIARLCQTPNQGILWIVLVPLIEDRVYREALRDDILERQKTQSGLLPT